MDFVVKTLVLLLGIIGGTLLVKYSYPLTQLFGHNSLAERYLGDGGTYTMWKLIGIAGIAGTVWYAFS